MAFATGLAVIGGALAVGLHNYLSAAADQTNEIRTRIALESAAAEVLGRLAGGEAVPLAPSPNAGEPAVRVSLVSTKVDPAADAPGLVHAALTDAGVQPDGEGDPRAASGLAALSALWRLDAAGEDCLRRVLTYGRAPAPRADVVEPERLQGVSAGDQLDVRTSIRTAAGDRALWVRARFTGRADGWVVHDYRRLAGPFTC